MNSTAHKPTERVLNILQLLSITPEGLTLTEIAEAIQSPKSTIFPIMHTMVDRSFIFLNKSTLKYTIGLTTYCVGASYSIDKHIVSFIKNEMKDIVRKLDETCQMGVLIDGNVLYILKEDPDKAMDIRLVSHIGKQLPAYCTALGKALLHDYSMDEIKALYPEGLKAMTQKTITDYEVLEEQLKKVKETNVATELEESTEYLCCYAVPLYAKGKTIAAISVSIPTFRATNDKINLTIELLLKAKENIEAYFLATQVDVDGLVYK